MRRFRSSPALPNRHFRLAFGPPFDTTPVFVFLAFSGSLSGGELGSEIGNPNFSFFDFAFGRSRPTTRWTGRSGLWHKSLSATKITIRHSVNWATFLGPRRLTQRWLVFRGSRFQKR
jgi:hypothetical protein